MLKMWMLMMMPTQIIVQGKLAGKKNGEPRNRREEASGRGPPLLPHLSACKQPSNTPGF